MEGRLTVSVLVQDGLSFKFDVCVAMSELTLPDLDVQCTKGFEFTGELSMWSSSWFMAGEAELLETEEAIAKGKAFGDIAYTAQIRNPMQMVAGFIEVSSSLSRHVQASGLRTHYALLAGADQEVDRWQARDGSKAYHEGHRTGLQGVFYQESCAGGETAASI